MNEIYKTLIVGAFFGVVLGLILGSFLGMAIEPTPTLKDRFFYEELCERMGGHPNSEFNYCNLAGTQVLYQSLLKQLQEKE